jgi:hypothetical protein
MADFDTLEGSIEDSRPIEVYKFALGLDTYRYTSAQDTITLDGEEYIAEAISRGQIAQGVDERNRNTMITMPASNAFARKYLDVPPDAKATVSIIRLQRDESPTFDTEVLIYKGLLQSVRFPGNGTIAEVVCRSLEAAASKNIPRYTFMSQCNHILFGPGCGVTAASYTHIGNADSVSDATITVHGLSASGLDVKGGYAQALMNDDFRLILSQSGDDITLLMPFGEDVTDTDIQVFAGCDHLLTGDCASTFDNVREFGGCAFVPSKNIFETGLDD